MTNIELKENLWGYAKRFRFVCAAIETAFPGKVPSELNILDVGCGSAAQLGVPLAQRGYLLTGIDTHEPSIAKARELAHGSSNANFITGKVEDLDSEQFDVIILSEVLEHVHEPEKLLKSSLQHLRGDGLVIVTVPNGYGEFEWDSWIYRGIGFDRLVGKFKERRVRKYATPQDIPGTENQDDGHVQFFTLRRIMQIFRSEGLDVKCTQSSTLMSGPFIAHTLGRYPALIDWNAMIADMLPLRLSSGWFFALRRQTENAR